MRITVLTFNTLGTPFFAPNIARRYKKISEIIASQDIDILCFQEIFAHYNRIQFDKLLTDYPYRIYKMFLPGLYGGLAVYSKIPIEFQEFITYGYPKDTFIPPYTRLARNGILVCKLKDIPLTLATTHLTSDTVHDLSPKNRFYKLINNQLEEAARNFTRLYDRNNSVLLVGDFNIAKDSVLYTKFLKTTGAKDVFAQHNTPTYSNKRISYIYPAQADARIDFMFYREGELTMKPEALGHMFEEKETLQNGKLSYLSDHIGLKATFEVK